MSSHVSMPNISSILLLKVQMDLCEKSSWMTASVKCRILGQRTTNQNAHNRFQEYWITM